MPRDTSKPNAIEARRRRVAELRLEGYDTPHSIAKKVGASSVTVWRDFKAIDEEWRRENVAIIDTEKTKDRKRLERMLRAIWPQIIRGDLQAVQTGIKLLERRAKLLGLDTPVMRLTAPEEPELPSSVIDVSVEDVAREYAVTSGLPYEEVLEGTMQLLRQAQSSRNRA